VTIIGSNFGSTQGSSTVSLNGISAVVTSWGVDGFDAVIPSGATSGTLSVTVNGQQVSSPFFTVTAFPFNWSDGDVGSVGLAGSATYANGTFTVKGAGAQIYGTADAFHYVNQPLSGDGTIVARVVSVQGGSGSVAAGVMIRETSNAGATNAKTAYWPTYTSIYFDARTTTGSSTSEPGTLSSTNAPYWVKVSRSGNNFSSYTSVDGNNWAQLGTTQTISMATNVYAGLAVTSGSTTALATATFDDVSVSSASALEPFITSLSATTGPIGSQVVISGSGFGTSVGGSVVMLNGAPVALNSWSNTSITITIPSGATSGLLIVSLAPTMSSSNPVNFDITSQPLPSGWLDEDVGRVGTAGSATYSNGTFTVKGNGSIFGKTADTFHYVYQPLSGDATIIARVVSVSGTYVEAGIMIRETLSASAMHAYTAAYESNPYIEFYYRSSTGGTSSYNGSYAAGTVPYWIKLVRSGSTFSAYASQDRVDWVQVGTNQTVNMATNAYVGLVVGNEDGTSALTTATFDNVSVSPVSAPAPAITSLTTTTGVAGSEVGISGSGFGASQGSSLVTINGTSATVSYWSSTSITITVPSGATSGPLLVMVAPTMNCSNPIDFDVTSQPLPTGWADTDIGTVGREGGATYANGVFTVQGAGQQISGTADAFNFVYQPFTGDGWIVARVVSLSSGAQGGVELRESFYANSTNGFAYYQKVNSFEAFDYRLTTGGSSGRSNGLTVASLPYWVKIVRSGSTVSAYAAPDGVFWTQLGTSQTINMASTVYIGLGVVSGSTTTLATATFDNVSITYGTAPPTPIVSAVSPTAGKFGASVTITGAHFGASQGSSSARFNGTSATSITSWSDTQVVAAVPTGATSGPVTIVASYGGSNQSIGFTVANPSISNLAPPAAAALDSITLNGSGFGATQGNSTVAFNSVNAVAFTWSDTSITVQVPQNVATGPVTVTESGIASNSVQFTLIEGLSVTGVSPASGPIGSSVTITGTGFGATQSNSSANFDGVAATSITSWSDTQIVAVVPSGASTGYVSVQLGGTTAYGPLFTLTGTVQTTDSLGNTSSYSAAVVSGLWYVTDSQGSGCSTCTQRGTIHSTYDGQGNLLTKTDALGFTTTYTYDSNGNVLSASHPDGNGHTVTTSYTYNSFAEVLTTTDPLGNVTTNTYDSNGNLLTVTTPAPNGSTAASVTTFTYDTKGELLTIKDPLNNVTTLTYTTAGLIATIKDAQNNVTTYGYDAFGNRTSVKDANNQTTTFAYDTRNRLTKITYPDTTTTQFGYDYRGRRTSVTDQNGKVTTYTYDDADRLLTVTDAATPGNVTTYGYDTEDNLTSIKDANNNTTSFSYDAFGRVTKTTFPSGYIEQYGYDADNNLTSKTDRKNQLITYTYDQLNRLTQKAYPDSTAVNYTYDLDSRSTQVSDPTGTYQFTFDNMGRLTGTTTNYAFLTSRSFTTSYGYDTESNRTSFTDPENGATAYVYDTLNRLQTLTPPTAFTSGHFAFSYDALSRRTQMTRPNGVATNYSYDNLSRLLSVLHQSGSTTLDGATYTVDNAGNRASRTPQPTGTASNFTYDALYELTQVTQGANTTESYTYDPVGNRLSSLGLSPYNYNTSNELSSTPSTSYTYDNNGNTLTKVVGSNTTSYTWDFENRLSSVTLPGSGGTVSFKYDPFGRRIYKSSSSGTSVYAYDGDNLIEETTSSGTVVARYEDTQNFDEPAAMLRSAATSYYHADGLGSVTSLSSAAGALTQTYAFDSFGKQTASSGSLTNPFQYTAREFDTETNLYFYRARYYDPATGRFLSEDPTYLLGGINVYNYVGNDPLDNVDLFGLQKCNCAIPAHPLDASLNQNIADSQDHWPWWWYNHVKQWHGPWDYKNYNGQPHPEWDDFGNFNYGATGAATGIPLNLLLRGAGAVKLKRYPGNDPFGRPWDPRGVDTTRPDRNYGNQPEKNQQIINGFNWYKYCFGQQTGGGGGW